ncbi:hypothetical protein SFC65_27415 [Priestia filamentosa]|uniref:hypothetical protein n=1 Tax=Priestia filamentosa TaxID=1402861 RepID=UPI00398216C8
MVDGLLQPIQSLIQSITSFLNGIISTVDNVTDEVVNTLLQFLTALIQGIINLINPPSIVDPGAISLCLFRNTFIWLRNGSRFWIFPIFVVLGLVIGFRWTGSAWTFYIVDTKEIIAFSCF